MRRSPNTRRTLALGLGWALALAWVGAAPGQDPVPASPPPAKPAVAPVDLPNAAHPPDAADPMVVAIVAAHNKLRADEKLPPLAFAPLLAKAAQVQAADMAERGEMTHAGSDGTAPADRVKRAGYRYVTTGENVAVFYPDVPQVMQAWVDSPPHKHNILGDFTELGVAKVEGRDGKPYWCVDFGRPMPKFDPAEAAGDLVARLNDARTAAEHPKLAANDRLAKAAQAQAVESARTSGKGGTPTEFTGLDTRQYRELAMSTAVGVPTPADVLKMFLDNPQYKERLLGPSTQVGVGYATDPEGVPYWCLILAKPARP